MSNRRNRESQIEAYMACKELLEASGRHNDPVYKLMLDMAASPLQGGAKSEMAANLMGGILGPVAAANMLAGNPPDRWPDFSQDDPFIVGPDAETGEAITIPGSHLKRHFLVLGPTGGGKSTFLRRLILWYIARMISVLYMDHKDDGRKLLAIVPSIVIIAVSQIYENLLKPIGDPTSYYEMFCRELGRQYNLHPGTEAKLVEILCDMHAGLKEGQPHFSLIDFEQTISTLAATRNDSTLKTGMRAVSSFNRSLGRSAYVREGPGVECGRWLLVVIECMGLNRDFLTVFSSIRLTRFMLRSREGGHSDAISSAYVSDEGQLEFGKPFQSRAGSRQIEAPERLITQVRSMGKSVAIAAQNVSKLMSTVPGNVGSTLCFGTQNEDDARISSNLLGMRSREERESLWNPPEYCAWFKCSLTRDYRLVALEDLPAGKVPSSEEVAERMKPHIEWLESQCVFSPIQEVTRTPINYMEVLGELVPSEGDPNEPVPELLKEQVDFLRAVDESPDLATRARYKELKISVGRGQKIRNALIAQKLLEELKDNSTGGRPIKRLRVTDKGKEYLDGLTQGQ